MKCQKRTFRSEEEAKESLIKIKRRRNENREKIPVRYYFCTKCIGWHLTSFPKGDDYNLPPAKLKHKSAWDNLIQEQNKKEYLFYVEPFILQLEKRSIVLLKNIEVECDLQKMLFDKKISLIRKKYKFKKA